MGKFLRRMWDPMWAFTMFQIPPPAEEFASDEEREAANEELLARVSAASVDAIMATKENHPGLTIGEAEFSGLVARSLSESMGMPLEIALELSCKFQAKARQLFGIEGPAHARS